jgi:hypothetical protein
MKTPIQIIFEHLRNEQLTKEYILKNENLYLEVERGWVNNQMLKARGKDFFEIDEMSKSIYIDK